MKKSYKVQLSSDIKFWNEIGSHVETDLEDLTGKTFPLGKRSEKLVNGNIAVMYEVVGVTNHNHLSHLTVYFGPKDNAKFF
jgi:hypothetical protein